MLNGPQQKDLHNALMSAFPTRTALEKMLLFELDKHLEEIVSGANLSDSVFTLIRAALSQGWLEDLVFAAHDSNPGNTLLLNFFKKFYLKSDRSVDYTQLRDLLKTGNWKDADYETYLVMLKVVGCEKGDDYDKDLLNFPCTDLRTIDRLWVKYSNGRFGFSVQKKIYLEVGGKADGKFYEEAWKKFGHRVGWMKNDSWIGYDLVTYDTIAPKGHLPIHMAIPAIYISMCQWHPSMSLLSYFTNMLLFEGPGGRVTYLFSRIQTCKL